MFGVETRVWSLTTPASDVPARLAALPEPGRREWLVPGALAPIARLRSDGDARYLRLSPGDPRRGPGSADRAYLTIRPERGRTVVEVAQRPARPLQLLLGGAFVAAWSLAALAAVYGLTTAHAGALLGVPAVLVARSLAEAGRRLDERRLRQFLTARLGGAGPTAAAGGRPPVRYGAPRYDVGPVDCR